MEQRIFRRSSRTFFFSSLLFSRRVRRDVFDLYSFLRVADDYVDRQPARPNELDKLKSLWQKHSTDSGFSTLHSKNDSLNERMIKNIVRLSRTYSFENQWVANFLSTMQADVEGSTFHTQKNVLVYVHGSAEVVGLMMSRIMGLPKELDKQARMQGRAFQWLNFIRDIEEDNRLGRCYFPLEDLEKFNLVDLSRETADFQPKDFTNFIHFQTKRYKKWQRQADQAYRFIPRRQRIALITARNLHWRTAQTIEKTPQIIFERKARPSRGQIAAQVITSLPRSRLWVDRFYFLDKL